MAFSEEIVRLKATDGFTLDAFVARPASGRKGGLVILQEIFGMTDQLKSVVRHYAEHGYETILPALYDRHQPGTIVPFETPDVGRDIMNGLDVDKVLLDIGAAADAVDSDGGVSVLGFCWGGGLALGAACSFDLQCGISYYGTKLPTYLDKRPNCDMLFHFGETDTANTPPEVIEQVREAIPTAEMHVYAAGHAFANDVRKTYVPEATETANARSLAFLDAHHAAANFG